MRNWIVGTAVVMTAICSVVAYQWWIDGNNSPPLKLGADFALTSHQGKQVSSADFRGKIMMVYFGYAFCPDVCPLSLGLMTNALDKLGYKAANVQPIFITIDPQRDTEKVLHDYVKNFHPRLLALTGRKEEVERVAQSFKVYVQPIPASKPGRPYLIDHSSFIYILDRDGQYIQHFHHSTPVEDIVSYLQVVAK